MWYFRKKLGRGGRGSSFGKNVLLEVDSGDGRYINA